MKYDFPLSPIFPDIKQKQGFSLSLSHYFSLVLSLSKISILFLCPFLSLALFLLFFLTTFPTLFLYPHNCFSLPHYLFSMSFCFFLSTFLSFFLSLQLSLFSVPLSLFSLSVLLFLFYCLSACLQHCLPEGPPACLLNINEFCLSVSITLPVC